MTFWILKSIIFVISNEDLKCLLPCQKLKLPSSTINAYGTWVQKQGEDLSEVRNACAIFSLWLGPLVTGKAKEGKIYGTFEGHVLLAVSIRHMHITGYLLPVQLFKNSSASRFLEVKCDFGDFGWIDLCRSFPGPNLLMLCLLWVHLGHLATPYCWHPEGSHWHQEDVVPSHWLQQG